jgi:hypothetical protein
MEDEMMNATKINLPRQTSEIYPYKATKKPLQ